MNKYVITDIELYTTEMGDGDPEWMLSDQEVYVLNQRCLTRWEAKDEDDLLDRIFNYSGFPVENMTYKINNVIVKYPRLRNGKSLYGEVD